MANLIRPEVEVQQIMEALDWYAIIGEPENNGERKAIPVAMWVLGKATDAHGSEQFIEGIIWPKGVGSVVVRPDPMMDHFPRYMDMPEGWRFLEYVYSPEGKPDLSRAAAMANKPNPKWPDMELPPGNEYRKHMETSSGPGWDFGVTPGQKYEPPMPPEDESTL